MLAFYYAFEIEIPWPILAGAAALETAIEKGTTSAAEKGTRSAIEKGTT
jgi:hypothetical protein